MHVIVTRLEAVILVVFTILSGTMLLSNKAVSPPPAAPTVPPRFNRFQSSNPAQRGPYKPLHVPGSTFPSYGKSGTKVLYECVCVCGGGHGSPYHYTFGCEGTSGHYHRRRGNVWEMITSDSSL